jgi:hypothetical protein
MRSNETGAHAMSGSYQHHTLHGTRARHGRFGGYELLCRHPHRGDGDMPLSTPSGAPTLIVRRSAFERAGLSRAQLDERLNLTADEFRVEGPIIAIGPIHEEPSLVALVEELEELGLTYFDDFFELSGNWPDWLKLFAMG